LKNGEGRILAMACNVKICFYRDLQTFDVRNVIDDIRYARHLAMYHWASKSTFRY